MISIIIPKCQDTTYMIRCLNAIRRQSYKNYEIIAIGDYYTQEVIDEYQLKVVTTTEEEQKWEGMNEAIAVAKGEFVLFCSMTSVLASDVLQQLRDAIEEEDSVISANYLIKENNEFNESVAMEFSVYGRLWRKEVLTANEEGFVEQYECGEKLYVLENLQNIEGVNVQEQAFIYETDINICQYVMDNLDQDIVERILLVYHKHVSEMQEKMQIMIQEMLQSLSDVSLSRDIIMELTQDDTVSLECKYQLAEEYVCKWFDECAESKDEELYTYIKDYLALLEAKEEFFLIILELLKISKKQHENMYKYNVQEWFFLKDKFVDEKTLEEKSVEYDWLQQCLMAQEESTRALCMEKESIQQLVALQEESTRKINELEAQLNVCVNTMNQVAVGHIEIRKEIEWPTGPLLADYVVKTSREGGLGVMTMFKAIGAWLKYKILGKRVK